jgi:hypothetical protein
MGLSFIVFIMQILFTLRAFRVYSVTLLVNYCSLTYGGS